MVAINEKIIMAKNPPLKGALLYRYFVSNEVPVGHIFIGGHNPVRVQSMTSTPTLDTEATVEQIMGLARAGCEIVRMTVQNLREAENLTVIKTELNQRGLRTPLAADVHFNPQIAFLAAKSVEKVRINPGNFALSHRRGQAGNNAGGGEKEREKVREEFLKLLEICRGYGTALRIGVNHGSLSPAIMNRYGDTPRGMVESAMEYLRICRSENFNNVVVSLKSSNTRVMVMSNRLMLKKMLQEEMNYPLHLGVTEAGEGEDGRIKSAVGIGALLTLGIGDTIRVSLTEEPGAEIPVAKDLVEHFSARTASLPEGFTDTIRLETGKYKRRLTNKAGKTGADQVPVVVSSGAGEPAPDYYYASGEDDLSRLPEGSSIIIPAGLWKEKFSDSPMHHPLFTAAEYEASRHPSESLNFVSLELKDLSSALLSAAAEDETLVFVLDSSHAHPSAEQLTFIKKLENAGCKNPVIIRRHFSEAVAESFRLRSAADLGIFFIDGLADGIWLENRAGERGGTAASTAFSILQSSRMRISRTEFISCPSCGRTMFDIRETAAQLKKHLSHLKGLKIAVMGCIVNGPGEMADADYGYVGSGKNHITLYKGQHQVKRNIPQEKALEELIDLIKQSGDWQEG